VVDVYALRLSVVVHFPLNHRGFNAFHFVPSRAAIFASYPKMKHSLLHLLLVASSFLPRPLSAQARPQPFPPSAMRSAYTEKLRLPGIPNSGRINDHLYRGAQPSLQGLAELSKLGITTVVDLRGEDPGTLVWERRQAESLRMRLVHIPVSGWSPPTDEQMVQFLSLFHNDPKQKIFVHCRFGNDRTGVFIAAYRMAFEKWPAEQALEEMYFFGFNGFWHPSMKTFIHAFPARMKSSPALSAVSSTPAHP
jgi:tyrosine-protein phosphatase SIW14